MQYIRIMATKIDPGLTTYPTFKNHRYRLTALLRGAITDAEAAALLSANGFVVSSYWSQAPGDWPQDEDVPPGAAGNAGGEMVGGGGRSGRLVAGDWCGGGQHSGVAVCIFPAMQLRGKAARC